jgi:hypothetical protein
MKHRAIATLLGVLLLTAASPARAANKEHQQLMADLRMLQEQAQLLQNLIGSVTEALDQFLCPLLAGAPRGPCLH